MRDDRPESSYWALLRIPSLARIFLGTALARVVQAMAAIALVLFTLGEYDSPLIAGVVTFASVFPGIVVSPIVGALLDRHGRLRLVVIDLAIAMMAMAFIAGLSIADALPPWLLVLIAALVSMTSSFSLVALRTLVPLIVPAHLWERVNAIDSSGFLVASIVGPPVAASLIALGGAQMTLLIIAACYGVAAVTMVGIPEPAVGAGRTGSLLGDARRGLVYMWRNATLRGLAVCVAVLNLAGGMMAIVVPLLVLRQLGLSEALVGITFALSGAAATISVFWFGRIETYGRERPMLAVPPIAYGAAIGLLIPVALATPAGSPGAFDPFLGFGLLVVAQLLIGLGRGPFDIALFTVRQRRTDAAWLGRALAVSMAVNQTGFPIGAAAAGVIAEGSLGGALVLGVAACLASSVAAVILIPTQGQEHDIVP